MQDTEQPNPVPVETHKRITRSQTRNRQIDDLITDKVTGNATHDPVHTPSFPGNLKLITKIYMIDLTLTEVDV